MNGLITIAETVNNVLGLFRQFLKLKPSKRINGLALISRMARDRVQPYANVLHLASKERDDITDLSFTFELLHYCRVAYAIYGSYEISYTLSHGPMLPTVDEMKIRIAASHHYKATRREATRAMHAVSHGRKLTSAQKEKANARWEMAVFADSIGCALDDIVYYSHRAKYFMPAYVIYIDHKRFEICLATRGTYELADFVTDLNAYATVIHPTPRSFEALIKGAHCQEYFDIDKYPSVTTDDLSRQCQSNLPSFHQRRFTPDDLQGLRNARNRSAPLQNIYEREITAKDLLITPINESTKYYGHAGVYAAAVFVYYQSLDILKGLLQQYPTYYLTFTGHSLGGDVSMLLGWFYMHSGAIDLQRMRVMSYSGPPFVSKSVCDDLRQIKVINVGFQNEFGLRMSIKHILFVAYRLTLLDEVLRRPKINKMVKASRHLRYYNSDKEDDQNTHGTMAKLVDGYDISHVGSASKPLVFTASTSVSTNPPRFLKSKFPGNDVIEMQPVRMTHTSSNALSIPTIADTAHSSQHPSRRQVSSRTIRRMPGEQHYSGAHHASHNPDDIMIMKRTQQEDELYSSMSLQSPRSVPQITNEYATHDSNILYSSRPGYDSVLPTSSFSALQNIIEGCDNGQYLFNVKDESVEPSQDEIRHLPSQRYSNPCGCNAVVGLSEITTPPDELKADKVIEQQNTYDPTPYNTADMLRITRASFADDATGKTTPSSQPHKQRPSVERQYGLVYRRVDVAEIRKMTDEELFKEYTSPILRYQCPIRDLDLYIPGDNYLIAFNFGVEVTSWKELLRRQTVRGVESHPAVRMFRVEPDEIAEFILTKELFSHHLTMYQGLLLLFYNLRGKYIRVN